MFEYEIMIKNLEYRVIELEKRTQCGGASTLTVRKWQPKGGNFFIQSNGKVSEVVGGSDTPHREFGVERPARQQAQRAAVEMRKFNRLLALRDELCGDELVAWGDDYTEKYHIYFSHERGRWYVTPDIFCESITPYFTTQELALKARDMLNSGEVELC
jgi:hypothetical protein